MSTFCSYFNQNLCRSCDLIEIDYVAQLTMKEERLKGLIHSAEWLPTVRSKEQEFRNKAKLIVSGTASHPVIGLPDGTELTSCALHVPAINALLPDVMTLIREAQISPYSVPDRRGEIKGLISFASTDSKEMYLRLVLRSKESIDRLKKHLAPLLHRHPDLKCVTANIQPVHQAILEGEEEIFLTERKHIHHRAGDVVLKLHPKAFVQTNQMVAKKLYETAALWVKENKIDRFTELFCGQGAFSFFCAPYMKEGLGVEINSQAVFTANETATENHLPQLRFEAADAAQVKELVQRFDPELILVNPPRRGLGDAIRLLQELKPRTIIYSSCHLDTLAKDLRELKGYQVRRSQIFDMFPHTSHFETLVELSAVDERGSASSRH